MNTPTCKRELVSPKKAAFYLSETDKSGFKNRNLSQSTINKYCGDIERGHWYSNTGETIKLGLIKNKPVVVDGQHRLQAIVLSGKDQYMWIFRYVPLDAFQFLDQGKPRDLSDILFIKGSDWNKESSILASTGRMLWKEDTTGDPAIRPSGVSAESDGNIANYLFERYSDLPANWALMKDYISLAQKGQLGGHAWLYYLLYRWLQLDGEKWAEVIEYLLVFGARRYANILLLRNPNSKTAVKLLFEHPTNPKPPTKGFELALDYILKIRMEAKEEGFGKVHKARNVDLMVETCRAYVVAWNSMREGRVIKTKKGFEKALKEHLDIIITDNGVKTGNNYIGISK